MGKLEASIYKSPFMKKLYYLCVFLIGSGAILAQQDVQLTQYMNNRLYYNPGVAGSGGAICVNGSHRSQWVGFEGAPVTQNITANIPLDVLRGGIGVSIVNEEIGFFNNINARLGYAYQLQLADGSLGFGIGATFMDKGVSRADWIPADFDPAGGGSGTDPFIAGEDANGFRVDMNFGVYYQSETFWAGVSSSRLVESNVLMDGWNTNQKTAAFRNARHYYAMGGYNWAIPGSNWELQPSTLVKFAEGGAPTVDVNATGVYNKKVWGGVTYRLEDAVAAMVGYQFTPSFKAGYAYDIPTGDLSGSSSGSHEIMVQYCFKIEIPPKQPGSYKNPRFL